MQKPTTTPRSLLILGDPIIPLNAQEQVVSRFSSGIKREAFYFLRGKQVGVRRWWDDGMPAHEWATQGELRHGRWVRFHSNGVPDLEASYWNGNRHGIRVQFDEFGRTIGTCEFREGDGVDLWFLGCHSGPPGLGEEWTYKKDYLHGSERWWNCRRISREHFWLHGQPHGILREWNLRGKLEHETPTFWLNGNPVEKAEYLKACASDPTLPVYSARDNSARRPFPTELVRKSRYRTLRIRQRIQSLPIVGEFGCDAPKEQVIEALRTLTPLADLTGARFIKVKDHIHCRFSQVTSACLCIDWIDDRWKKNRLSRATFHAAAAKADGTASLVEFSHVGLPLGSRREAQRLWGDEVLRKINRQIAFRSVTSEVPLVSSFYDDIPTS